MALPILAKTITSALVKKGTKAKNESKKVSAEKLLPGSTDKKKVKVSKFRSRKPKTYRNKFETSKFLPPSKIEEQFDMKKMDDLLMSLVDNTNDLKKATKKDVDDEKEKNIQKNNVKSKVKRNKREENIEEKKTVAKISKPMKFKTPDFLKDILGMGGRLILATGIMSILNYLTDPEKKDGLIQFLTDHMDKIILGTLATLGAVFVASFAPVIGTVGTILSILTPAIIGMVVALVKAAPLMILAYSVINQGLGRSEKEVIKHLEDMGGVNHENKEKLIEKYKQQIEDITVDLGPILGKGTLQPGVLSELRHRIRFLETGKFDYGSMKLEYDFGTPFDYNMGNEYDWERGETKQSQFGFSVPQDKVSVPQDTKPQTKALPGLKLGSLKGDSGSVAYAGQKRASLSTEYSPLAQSDIDEQNLSIISGKGWRESTGTFHKGYDIPAEEGTPIYAYFPGVILRNMPNVKGYGNLIEWKDDVYGQTHMFAHMMEPSTLSPGTKFKKGTVLGKIGNTDGGTGISQGPHLHWEIGPQRAEVDPGEWVRKHPLKVSPNQPKSNQDQNVSSQTSYEKSGTQVAMVQVPTPVPMPSGGGSGGKGVIIGGGTGLDVNRYILATHYKEA